MKKYIAVLNQDGGCDYTIGCGINTIQFEAENALEAAITLKKFLFDNYNNEEKKLASAVYYEYSDKYEVDMKKWYAEFDQVTAMAARENEKKKEIAEFERIKVKYNL